MYDEYIQAFESLYQITDVSKYRSFQYRLLTNCILLNDRLVHMRIVDNNLCIFVREAKKRMNTFFVNCVIIKRSWNQVQELVNEIIPCQLTYSYKNILFNNPINLITHVANLIVLIVKQNIFKWKCANNKPNVEIRKEVNFIQELEKSRAVKMGKILKYNKRWNDNIESNQWPDEV